MNTHSPSKRGAGRRSEEMKFAYSGPFSAQLDPIRAVKPAPERDSSGRVIGPERKYAATSPGRYTIGSRIGGEMVTILTAAFGRETHSAPGRSSRGRRNRKSQVKS